MLGQQIVIDNRAGAAGVIGMEIAKDATPDGYTVIAATTAASTIARILQKNPRFDPLKDYDYVVQFAETPNVLVVNPSLPIKSTKELIDYAKGKQGQFNMASAGAGSQSHLSGAYFLQAAKFESLHVPYKGGGPSVASVVADESQWTLTPAPAVMVHVNAGRLRAIGQSLPKRTPLLPNVPADRRDHSGLRLQRLAGLPPAQGHAEGHHRQAARGGDADGRSSPRSGSRWRCRRRRSSLRGPEEFRKVVAGLDGAERPAGESRRADGQLSGIADGNRCCWTTWLSAACRKQTRMMRDVTRKFANEHVIPFTHR